MHVEFAAINLVVKHLGAKYNHPKTSQSIENLTYVMPPQDNQYIPKFILNVPWYYSELQGQENDAFVHQRKDASLTGDNAKNAQDQDFSAKRDRWHGYKAEEWDEILAKWDEIKKANRLSQQDNEDSDDTDYELELQELGIERSEFQRGFVEDPLEKSIKERKYTPAYILAINANQGGKIRIGKDSTKSVANDESDFVKEPSKEEKDFKQMRQFAWEQNQQYEQEKLRELYQKQLANLSNPNAEAVDNTVPIELGFSVEASPTLIMMKKREEDKKKKEASEKRKKSLLDRYG